MDLALTLQAQGTGRGKPTVAFAMCYIGQWPEHPSAGSLRISPGSFLLVICLSTFPSTEALQQNPLFFSLCISSLILCVCAHIKALHGLSPSSLVSFRLDLRLAPPCLFVMVLHFHLPFRELPFAASMHSPTAHSSSAAPWWGWELARQCECSSPSSTSPQRPHGPSHSREDPMQQQVHAVIFVLCIWRSICQISWEFVLWLGCSFF